MIFSGGSERFNSRFLARSVGATILMAVCFLLLGITVAHAQESVPTLEEIDQQIAALTDATGLEEGDLAQAQTLLEEAKAELIAASEREARVDDYVDSAMSSREIIEELDEQIADQQDAALDVEIPDTIIALRSRLNARQTERGVQEDRRIRLLDERTLLAGRASAIAGEIAAARGALDDLEEVLADGDAPIDESVVGQARQTLQAVRLFARRAEVNDLNRELQSIPERQSIVSTRIALRDVLIAALDQEIDQISERLSGVRDDLAESARSRAEQDLVTATEISPADVSLAEQNIDLATRLKTMAEESLAIDNVIKETLQQNLIIRQQAETVERIIATGRVTTEAGTLLRRLRSSLPSSLSLRNIIDDAVEARAETQLSLALWQERLNGLQAFDNPLRYQDEFGALTENDIAILSLQRSLLENQETLLQSLIDAGQDLSDRLTQKEISVTETLAEAQELRNNLNRRLLWLPSNVRPFSNFQGNFMRATSWMSSPEGLRTARSEFESAIGGKFLIAAVLLLLAALAYTSRDRLGVVLAGLNEDVGKIARDRYGTTPLALCICLLLAFPIPGILLAMSMPVLLTEGTGAHLTAFTGGIVGTALFVWLVFFVRNLTIDNGVMEIHFGWSRKACAALRNIPLWALIAFGLALFLLASTVASQRSDVEYSIGMIVLFAVSFMFAAFSYRVFELEKGLFRLVLNKDRYGGYLLLGLIAFCLAPVVIGSIPLFGYFDTAIALQERVLGTAALLGFLVILYGVFRRLIQIAQRRYVLRKARERRVRRAAERAAREAEGEEVEEAAQSDPAAEAEEIEAERKRVTAQALTLLFYFEITGALLGILVIWGTILPALGAANDITLWTGVDTIDGVRTVRPVTLWNLILFFLFIGASVIAASNIRGLLEIGPLQRLKLSAGSRFAIHTIIGYVLVGVGIVAGFLQLGVDWSRLQWIIAALGVGLGFGLQEIVANFISGLIILFERPVRVGDTVTIGDLDGDVTNIAIRATTIKDFDNREVLLPNKSIITENVTNWTLSDTIMRIILDIGVAYGSDLEKVRDVLLKCAADEPDVLDTPEPRLFFMNHGDSSLDYELRVFISNPRKRFRVRDRLNTAINMSLAEAGIEIPFPQRDVHLKQS